MCIFTVFAYEGTYAVMRVFTGTCDSHLPPGRPEGGAPQPAAVPAAPRPHQAARGLQGDGEGQGQEGHRGIPGGLHHHADDVG